MARATGPHHRNGLDRRAERDPLADTFGRHAVAPDRRRELVRRAINRRAAYDLMNDLMSLGIHRAWKAPSSRRAAVAGEARTCSISPAAPATSPSARWPGARVTVADPSVEMMAVGRARRGGDTVAWVGAEPGASFARTPPSTSSPSPSASRNVTRMDAALAENPPRVLRPGERFLCLEFSTPRALARPDLSAVVAHGDPRPRHDRLRRVGAYHYLVRSIARFPDQAEFAEADPRRRLREHVAHGDLSFGIAAIHRGVRV